MGGLFKMSKQSYSIDKTELDKILLCILCRHNLDCRLWENGEKNCKEFSIAKMILE